MNLTLLAQSKVFATLQDLARWLVSPKTPTQHHLSPCQPIGPIHTPRLIDFHATQISGSNRNSIQHKPLRVVHVLEAGQAQSSGGRMVISGRMADVCAELDRLAACEATSL